jgi:hypothetical protein
VQKAGSEELAREKLEMIIYNETHGPPERRVRNRRSVLITVLRAIGIALGGQAGIGMKLRR